ncbi:MAG: GNAT family N-acetyltransferase [bacterium]
MRAEFSLESARLRMRELTRSDLPFVCEMLGDADVMRFYPRPLDTEECAAWIERQCARYASDGHGLWLVEDRASGLPVGQAGLVMQHLVGFPKPRYAEVGYLLHRPFWKRGYATESAATIRHFAHEALGYDEVISLIRPENEPSQAVARRLGMHVIGETIYGTLPHLVFGATHGDSPITDDATPG